MDYSQQFQAIDKFIGRAPLSESSLTLGGTGPNGSIQVTPLVRLGQEAMEQLSTINIISASSYAYFIHYAYGKQLLNVSNYLKYDGLVRRLHSASFLKGLLYLARREFRSKPLYDSRLIKGTAEILFSSELVNTKLIDLPANLRFWCYCSNEGQLVELSAATFPDMKVWEVIAACVCVGPLHGEFHYQGHALSDANFSPKLRALWRRLTKDQRNHLYFNYKRTFETDKVIFVQNSACHFPNARLMTDLLRMVLNIPNGRVNRTNSFALGQMTRAVTALATAAPSS